VPDDPAPLALLVRGVGAASLVLAAAGLAAPRALAGAAGVRTPDDATLPVLVRLVAARQAALGLALLTRSPVDARRSAGLFLPVTVADAAAVVAGARAGVLARRSLVMAGLVLATNVWAARAAGR
jgi:hypothetical protein